MCRSVRGQTSRNSNLNVRPLEKLSPRSRQSTTDINLCVALAALSRPGKPWDTFVWHYPKHEFYYAFNKLVMQLHVVCQAAPLSST